MVDVWKLVSYPVARSRFPAFGCHSRRMSLGMTDQSKFQVDAEISRDWSIPAEYYTADEVFAAEKERIFRGSWQVVAHHDQVRHPGDYITTELIGEPLLIVRLESPVAGLLPRAPPSRRTAGGRMWHPQTVPLRISRLDLQPGWRFDQRTGISKGNQILTPATWLSPRCALGSGSI